MPLHKDNPPIGQQLLALSYANKATAFSHEERRELGLLGLLPYSEESLDKQVQRAQRAYAAKSTDLERHIYLRQLQDFNETVFYKLIVDNAAEMIPIIYTPTVGDACRMFSEIYRRPRGLFFSYPERDHIEEVIANVTSDSIEIVVITDGEAILGIGDQGVGGMGIPIGKLALYAALGGINPSAGLPVLLDVGTDNEQLLEDPMYMGWQHERLRGGEYDEFVEQVMAALHEKWPHAVIQFEDFASDNAVRLLDRYADRMCCFNDDIQGTAVVTVGSLLAACNLAGKKLEDCRIVIVGTGAAGTGIAQGCLNYMTSCGLDEQSAARSFYLVGRHGLIHEQSDELRPSIDAFAHRLEELADWGGEFGLLDVVRNAAPDILIGVTGQPGLFTKQLIQEMDARTSNPIVFPLSNPTAKAEVVPEYALQWTHGKAIIATGSPFPDVEHGGKRYKIAQCNNAYAFPGIGLGLTAVRATRVTDEMLAAVAKAIGISTRDSTRKFGMLLPDLGGIQSLSRDIAIAIGEVACSQGLGEVAPGETVESAIDAKTWKPKYANP